MNVGSETGEKSETAKREEETLAFWQKEGVFQKSLEKEAPKGEFVFYDGPPFATGLPHSGSLLASVSKDLIPRYKTMRGYRVRRRWGWDTHGLPIESLVEKKLGLKNKKEILTLGIEKFNETARSMVLEYVHDWKRYVDRLGRWVDFDNSYKTMDNLFIESVWWGLKEIHKKGRLYEGRKVLLYCPHCETPLAKAEIAMDNTYKDITEDAVTVKFKVQDPKKHGLPEHTFLLAWTTTPWTLPGNVALAIGKDIEYVIWHDRKEGVHYVMGAEAFKRYGIAHASTPIRSQDLVGVAYEPLYEIEKVVAHHSKKKWTVLSADFVNTTDGTGIVHTAVMYGEDDYRLGVKEELPMIPLLNPNATYNHDAPKFLRGEYIKKASPKIIDDLQSRDGGSLVFTAGPHTHSYPHCYRCSTPLIYNAVSSWFIDIQSVKKRMLSENKKIQWIPEHLKSGRFRHNIETAPDWTISRNRFWASPLPIWKDKDGRVLVIGSLEELRSRTKKSGNAYFAMRHGESEHNVENLVSSDPHKSHLTDHGKEEIRRGLESFHKGSIDIIYASPLLRSKETAEYAASFLGVAVNAIRYDNRLRELDFGSLSGKPFQDFIAYRESRKSPFTEPMPGGESYVDAKQRFGEFLYELESTLTGKRVLIVTHGIGFESFVTVARGGDAQVLGDVVRNSDFKTGGARQIDFVPLPHNKRYELDLHLPYIDRVQLEDEKGRPLTRIPEVVDCWVESGSMPFAEYHYPFENKKEFEKRSPGDFISEYIGQTRAWFYYLHAIGVELFGRRAFRNVITTGNILATDSTKLSKSKGNYTDPYELFNRYGADAFRYYLMSSVVMQAEDLMFRDEEVKEAHARIVNMLRNVLAFYLLFAGERLSPLSALSEHPLDRWILLRLASVVRETTEAYDAYDVPRATRPIRSFVEDLSAWYVRRSRDRVKGADASDKARALATLRFVLTETAKLIAPVMPFVAEDIYQGTRRPDDPISVHLADWPSFVKVPRRVSSGWSAIFLSHFAPDQDKILMNEMASVRSFASEALQLRQKTGIKVRQPLASFSITGSLSDTLAQLLAEEINVQKVLVNQKAVMLDTALTPELIKEGDNREMARAVAEARKSEGFSTHDSVETEIVSKGEDWKHSVELSRGTVYFNLKRNAS